LVEDNDDEQGGPAVSRVGAKRHTDHDSAMRLCGICQPPLPIPLTSGR
jgi:hypothetical protein